MNNKIVTSMVSAAALTGVAYAGPTSVVKEERAHSGSWCDTLKTIGTIHSDKENPYIQKIKFFGRAQVQYGYIDGNDVNDDGFNDSIEEVRRLRFGTEVKFLNGFKLKANANFIADGRNNNGEREIEYTEFDQAKLSYTFKDLLGFDQSSITYGRYKVALGAEQHTSSKKIKTVERSAIANRLTSKRPTGASIDLKNDGWSATFGVFSNEDADSELLTGWGESVAVYASTKFNTESGKVILDAIYNDRQEEVADDPFGYEWAASAAYMTSYSNWDITLNAILGDNGDLNGADRDGLFYGFVALGTTDLVEDKLEFVARYAFQGAEEEEGIRTNSRHFRNQARHGGDVNSGRGDSHHSVYAGLNWYFCGDHSKVMTGIEYDNLATPDGTADSTTLWLAYRMYF